MFFDLQNELSGGWTRLSRQDVRTLAGAVRATDRSRLLSASDFDPDPGRQVALVRDAKLDILNFHDSPRDERWPGHTAELVASFTSALAGEKLAIPVYQPASRLLRRTATGRVPSRARSRVRAPLGRPRGRSTRGPRSELDERDFAGQLDANQRPFFDGLRAARSTEAAGRPARR